MPSAQLVNDKGQNWVWFMGSSLSHCTCLARLTCHHPVSGSLFRKPVPDGDSAISGAAPHLMGLFQSCCHLDGIGGHEPLRGEKRNLTSVTLPCQGLDQEAGGDRQRGSGCRAREGASSRQKGRRRVGGVRQGAQGHELSSRYNLRFLCLFPRST